MTNTREWSPKPIGGVTEIVQMEERIRLMEGTLNTALDRLARMVGDRVKEATDQLADVPARLAVLEELLRPLTVDPADPDVEWAYRRSDGILVNADPDKRLDLIAAGIPLFPVVHRTREDGRMTVTPPPKMVDHA